MSISDDRPSFHVVPEPEFHGCGHYHMRHDPCPGGRCDSYLCCVPGGDGDDDAEVDTASAVPASGEHRAVYGSCSVCFESHPLIGHAGLTACHNAVLIYL